MAASGNRRQYWLNLSLPVGTVVYFGLAGWLTFAGIRHGGSNIQTAFGIAALVAAWPIAWGFGVWSAVIRAGFSRRGTLLIVLTVSQMAIAVLAAYIQAASVASYFEALPLPLLAFIVGVLWYARLGIERAERAAETS